MTFEEAGSDADLRESYRERQINTRRKRGDELLAGARAVMRRQPSRQGRAHAERAAREALASYASALNWAEDTEREDHAHRQLDDAGHWVRHTFGCHLYREGQTYSQRCPVALSHNRLGMSVGGVARRVCSLCGEDLSDCEHQRRVAYLVPGGPDDLGWCRVCLKEAGCEHNSSQQYRVNVVAIVTEVELAEVSLVGKPAQPDARFTSIGIDTADLKEQLGLAFAPGSEVGCDRCLSRCNGLTKHDAFHL